MGLLCRLNFFDGRLLSAENFEAEQEYHREKSRRHSEIGRALAE